mmetsp:Transcript_12910/g.30208  ORF Transcript_12910/g.30208 Transcript_12910/m.30208 type:complete len:237 (-) Transcript_12910:231-941(-)|eukprot:CAMPEP_0178426142 /NCGR_PEP_ID=MMETSP0689_2-20121128/29085_1 /TAXON_ID=160604 /ORGANISM="Amphidinium massartii, Strain CS-259" /LENGTH=236 /DNA_ID=CAMNT_0020047825 /DNA_START=115 /DNA_END=825 /DNA_ORIENTATION=-
MATIQTPCSATFLKQGLISSDDEASTKYDDVTPVSSRSGSVGAIARGVDSESVASQPEEELQMPAAEALKPRKHNDLRLNQLKWDSLAFEYRTTLSVRGLPRKDCVSVAAFQALLDTQGLSSCVKKIKVAPMKPMQKAGCVAIQAKSVEDVSKLAKFFHGWAWDLRMPPVAVSFARKEEVASKKSRQDKDEPKRLTGLLSESRSGGLLDVPQRLRDFPPGLRPPPGLEMMAPLRPF